MANIFDQFDTETQQNPFDQFDAEQAPVEAGFSSVFTGEGREAPETQQLPELQKSGLLSGLDPVKAAAITPALLTATDPNEIAQIVSSNFPDVAVQYQKAPDNSVYPVLTNRQTGAATVINRPGISSFDVLQGLGLMAAYTPAGMAKSVPMAAATSGATGAAIETAQAASGGEFDPETPILDALFGGFGQKAVDLIDSARAGNVVAKEQIESKVKDFAKKGFKTASYGKTPKDADQVSQMTDAILQGDEQRLAAMIDADPDFTEAMKTLDLTEAGLPSAASRNRSYQEIEQSLKKMPGSPLSKRELDSVTELQQKADNFILEYGGTAEKATLSQDVLEQTKRNIEGLGVQAENVYKAINDKIEPARLVDTDIIQNALNNELADVAGRVDQLTALERSLLELVDGDVTYKALDRRRKQIGEAIGGQGGVFKDASKAELNKYYRLLTEAQEKAAPEFVEQWNAGKKLVSKRKAMEDVAIDALGKDLSKNFMPQFGQASLRLAKGKTKEFDKLIKNIPEARRREVVLSALNDVFTQGSRKEQQLSVAGFADWFNSVNRDPALKGRIYRYLPKEARSKLDAFGKVANGIRQAQSAAPIGGQVMASQAVLDKIMNGVGKHFLSKLPGFLGAVVEQGVQASKNEAIDKGLELLSDPVFTKNLRLLASEQAELAEKRIMRSKAFKDFSKTLTETEAKTLNTVGLREWLTSDELEKQEN